MGLDAVELVMTLEERFGVELPDAECSHVKTVADLAAVIVARLPKPSGTCPTAKSFFQLRTLLTTHGGRDRCLVRPRTRLDELFPKDQRHVWKSLRTHQELLPRLVTSDCHDKVLLWTSATFLFVLVGVIAALCATLGTAAGFMFGALFFIVGLGVVSAMFSTLAVNFPPEAQTVGDVARLLAPVEMPRHNSGERLLAQQRVLDEVRRLTAEALGLKLDTVKPESDFVKDLGT